MANREDTLQRINRRLAKHTWSSLVTASLLRSLRELTQRYGLSIAAGHILLLDGRWYVTHVGLLEYAKRHRCRGMQVEAVSEFCDPASNRWAFRATAFLSRSCKGFVGFGDADPSNVSPIVRGAEMRVAETRAVNRALRKAYGIGMCSVEELGALPNRSEPAASQPRKPPPQSTNGNGNGGPRVRDRLCQIIRQHQLDPDLVKSYAVDFCGTETLKEASRAQVENFVEHLADWAQKDRNALLCQLNSYLPLRKKEQAKEEETEKEGAA
jgi:hypothetical protein